MDWGTLAGIFTMFGAFSALMIWLMTRMENRLHTDITSLCVRLDGHIVASGERFDAINARADAINARVDQTQAIIMRMLEKKGM
jgi:hypothetical protein